MSIIEKLADLQQNYDKVNECNKILKDGAYIYLLKKLKKEFEEKKDIYEENKKALEELKGKYVVISKELRITKSNIDEDEYKLYNNAGSDLKLIENLQNKIALNKHRLKELEDNAIAMLETEEKLKFDTDQERLELINLKSNFYSCRDKGNRKITKAQKEKQEANLKIKEICKTLPSDVLQKFGDLMITKGTAAVKLQGGVCKGCGIKVSSVTIDKVMKDKGIVCCDNCGRILIYNDIKYKKEA
ncbi:MAG: C4-type zinc ribbon domain-containing protein [Bacillota bacterium]|nr:C4-type zinc ribbon domain-containing protein [Bacillota bacterium]